MGTIALNEAENVLLEKVVGPDADGALPGVYSGDDALNVYYGDELWKYHRIQFFAFFSVQERRRAL